MTRKSTTSARLFTPAAKEIGIKLIERYGKHGGPRIIISAGVIALDTLTSKEREFFVAKANGVEIKNDKDSQ